MNLYFEYSMVTELHNKCLKSNTINLSIKDPDMPYFVDTKLIVSKFSIDVDKTCHQPQVIQLRRKMKNYFQC